KRWTDVGTITTCNKCHGRSNSLGYPDYGNGGANNVNSNLHTGHLAGMTDTTACADCHRKTADAVTFNRFRPFSTAHLNGSRDVSFNKTKAYVGNNANAVTAGNQVTCSSVVCHGQAGSPQLVWGNAKSGSGGAGVRTCTKCHGNAASSYSNYTAAEIAPGFAGTGTDTSMINTAGSFPRVGTHQQHLATNVISAAVKCGECHVTLAGASDAAAMRSANHWNMTTAKITFNGKAFYNGHSPTVSRAAGIMQCSNVNCHSGKYSSGTTTAPFWNNTGIVKANANTVGACVACHAMPPLAYANHPQTPLSNSAAISTIYASCGSCHTNLSNTATNVGNVFTNKALHINGTINYVANCDSCHAYDLTGGGTTWTPALSGGAGTGAHVKHIAFIKSRLSIVSLTAAGQTFGVGEPAGVCGTCHTNTLSEHDNGSRQITFGTGGTANTMGAGYSGSMSLLLGGTNPSFSTGAKSCSNIICHYATTPSWY